MSEEMKLKNCPFCGAEASFVEDWDAEGDVFWVGCSKLCMTPVPMFFQNKEVAVAAWNRRVPESGINSVFEDVKAFHVAFGHPIGKTPHRLVDFAHERRVRWIREELAELDKAGTAVDQADAVIDMIYFAIGYLVEMGIPPSGVWNAVQQANMAKMWPDGVHRDNLGKVVKSPDWRGPENDIQTYIKSLSESPGRVQ